MSGGDWLRAAVSAAPWRCVTRRRPRAWYCGVRFQVVMYGSVQPGEIGFTVSELDSNDNQVRRNETIRRFYQTKQRIFTAVDEVLMSGRFQGMKFQGIGPPGGQMADVAKERRRAIAEESVERDVVIEPTNDNDPLTWTVRHRPSGAFVFMYLERPFSEMSKEAQRAALSDCMDRLDNAVGMRVLPVSEVVS